MIILVDGQNFRRFLTCVMFQARCVLPSTVNHGLARDSLSTAKCRDFSKSKAKRLFLLDARHHGLGIVEAIVQVSQIRLAFRRRARVEVIVWFFRPRHHKLRV